VRLAYVCADHGIPLRGDKGASVHLRSLAGALAARGHSVTVLARNLNGVNGDPPSVHVAELPWRVDEHGRFFEERLAQLLPDVVLERYSLDSGPAMRVSRALGIDYALEVNAPLVAEAVQFRRLPEDANHQARERELFVSAGTVFAVSTALRDHIVACGADASRVHVVHNGVDVAQFNAADGSGVRKKYGLDGAVVVGFAGSLRAWHGVARLLWAARALPAEYSLLIVGGGNERHLALELARALGIGDRVVVTGEVNHSEVASHLAAMDVAVAPYEAVAGFYFSPLKVMEYMAAGLAIVASREGDIPDVIDGCGVLVEPGDERELAAAISRVGGDPELRARLSQASRERAHAYSWARVASTVEAVLAPR